MVASQQKLGLGMAIIVGMNAMIGAGIFSIPEQLQRIVGPACLLTYVFVTFAVWCIAYSLARVAQARPQESSFFNYAAIWGGPVMAKITAVLYVSGLIVALGLLTRLTGIYLHTQIPGLSDITLGIITLLVLTVSLLVGMKMLKSAQIVLILLTLLPMAFIAFLCLTKASVANLVPFAPYGFWSIFKAAKIVVFGFLGFESIILLHSKVDNPSRTVPQAMTGSLLIVSAIYLTFVASIVLGLPQQLFSDNKALPEVLYAVFPSFYWLVTAIVWGIIITIMGTVHAMLYSLGSFINNEMHWSQNKAISILSVLVLMSTLAFKNLTLFFNITAITIIAAYVAGIVPLAGGYIHASKTDRFIALLGIASAILMCWFAADGILTAIRS